MDTAGILLVIWAGIVPAIIVTAILVNLVANAVATHKSNLPR